MTPFTDQRIQAFWTAKPFPYLIIDNFLPLEDYLALVQSLKQESGKKAEKSFNTPVEKNKECFANDGLNPHLNNLVKELTSKEFLLQLRYLTGLTVINPLTDYPSNEFRYHHVMKDNGFLGSHVDHTFLPEAPGMVHFLNSIFYAPEVWSPTWGGHTFLENPHTFVEYKPNRVLIFLMTSKSFHGVTRLTGSSVYKRHSIYMDYYTHKDNLPYLIAQSRRNDSDYIPEFWKHGTTFVPSLKTYKYWLGYLKYLSREPL